MSTPVDIQEGRAKLAAARKKWEPGTVVRAEWREWAASHAEAMLDELEKLRKHGKCSRTQYCAACDVSWCPCEGAGHMCPESLS